jgi:hypothetical protein
VIPNIKALNIAHSKTTRSLLQWGLPLSIFHKLVFASSLVARGLVGVMGAQGGTCLNSIIVHPNWCIRGCWFTLPNSTIVCPMSFTQKCWLVFYKAKMERGPSHNIGLVVYLTSLKNSANQSDPLDKKKMKKKHWALGYTHN